MKNLKNLLILFIVVFVFSSCQNNQKAKYVFLFIGDGMGLSHRAITEMYNSSMNGEIGQKQLLMDSLPIQGYASTYSANSYITCSAAAGTALATGTKTKNGMLGLNPDTLMLQTIAEKAKLNNKSIGIITTVILNHATPGAFYAHQPNRNEYEEIKNWMLKSDFDYFAGGIVSIKDSIKQSNVNSELKDAGYYVATNRDEMNLMKPEQKKWVLYGDDLEETYGNLKYVLDRKENAIGLVDMLQKAIDLLSPNKEGFFIMLEGGKIDFLAHDNDGASMVHEIMELDDAIRVAMNFYKKHPNETLIIVTADHETGGLGLGNNTMGYKMNPKFLSNQKISLEYMLNARDSIMKQIKTEKDAYSFAKQFGLLEYEEYNILKREEISKRKKTEFQKDSIEIHEIYQKYKENGNSKRFITKVIEMVNIKAGIEWTTKNHTGVPVPVSAIGVGAEQFSGMYDNTDIPKKIEKLMQLD